jgi:serine/threonine protein kinase
MIGQQVNGKQGGQFTIIREIGRGGFGVVYLAEDKAKQPYALKVISPVNDPTVRLSFEQEIQSTVGLTHQNLLAIVDYGTCDVGGQQGLFAVSEYCPDGDYRRKLSAGGGPRSTESVVSDFRQILDGLHVLHSRIIHRDLKPENVLLSGTVLKIGDYGLAKFVDEATRTFSFKGGGTPRYMAPEVWLAQRGIPATDLYAVGVMLFEAVTGQPPFMAMDLNEFREKHLYAQAPRAKSINNQVPDSVDGVIRKLLAKEPQQRDQTANEVLDALQVVPAPANPEIAEIAARMRQHHDAAEAQRLEQERRIQAGRDSIARNKLKEQEVLDRVEEAVDEINRHLAETKIEKRDKYSGREFWFRGCVLHLHFFQPEQLYPNSVRQALKDVLRARHVVHGGYIQIKDQGEHREGWNLVLVRPPESMYGEWRIVETRVSILTGRGTKYEPIATEATLFAENLAFHWMHAMHTYNLTDKALEHDDIVKILKVFIPNA